MSAFYNEHDPGAAAWLRELQSDRQITPGPVDERSIHDVAADDVMGHERVHFFAGIAGWELALELAGWPVDRPVWTGSCPCQDFSQAGVGRGAGGERHLWPEMLRLIRECQPVTIFGEQVKAAIGFQWLDGVSADLEAAGYTVGACVLGAHSVGSPHIRQRLYWVAHRECRDAERHGRALAGEACRVQSKTRTEWVRADVGDGKHALGVDDEQVAEWRSGRSSGPRGRRLAEAGRSGGDGRLGNAECAGREGLFEFRDGSGERATRQDGMELRVWDRFSVVPCADGKARRAPVGAQPRVLRVEDGVSGGVDLVRQESYGFPIAPLPEEGRTGLLRGLGNAIVPQVAAAFIRAFLECEVGG